MDAKQFLHETMNEWDTVFNPPEKCEYSEEQLIRFAELWANREMLALIDRLTEELIDTDTK
tara:strand:- start:3487 stop:3669 length:183 start_codon:yes stop_codon:yes gene_type:complete